MAKRKSLSNKNMDRVTCEELFIRDAKGNAQRDRLLRELHDNMLLLSVGVTLAGVYIVMSLIEDKKTSEPISEPMSEPMRTWTEYED